MTSGCHWGTVVKLRRQSARTASRPSCGEEEEGLVCSRATSAPRILVFRKLPGASLAKLPFSDAQACPQADILSEVTNQASIHLLRGLGGNAEPQVNRLPDTATWAQSLGNSLGRGGLKYDGQSDASGMQMLGGN